MAARVLNDHPWLQKLEVDMDFEELEELADYLTDSDPLDVDESKIDQPDPEKVRFS